MRILCAHFPMHTAHSKVPEQTHCTLPGIVWTQHTYTAEPPAAQATLASICPHYTRVHCCAYIQCVLVNSEHSTLLSEHCIVLGHIEATVKSHYCAHRLHRAHSAHRHSVVLNKEEVNKVNITHCAMHSGHCKS